MDEIKKLLAVITRLRAPDGCPWDREQTLKSLKPQLLDEAYEVLAAINNLDRENLQEELGDLLFGILMICRVAEDEAGIPFSEVAGGITEKMIRRHPHVFGEVEVKDSEEVVKNWEEIKSREKNHARPRGFLGASLAHLPALRRAQKIQARARKVGFDWDDVAGVVAKIREELVEVEAEMKGGSRERLEAELGDLLFSVVNLVRFYDLEAEFALHRMIDRWIARFGRMEEKLKVKGLSLKDASFEEMDRLWDEAAGEEQGIAGRSRE